MLTRCVWLFIALSFSFTTLSAQQPIVVPLDIRTGSGPFQEFRMLGNLLSKPGDDFKLTGRMTLGAIRRFDFDPGQPSTQKAPDPATSLYVYSGMDDHGNFLIIPDRNHNKDFNDDTALVFGNLRLSKTERDSIDKLLPYEIFHIPVWEPDAVHDVSVWIRFIPADLITLKMRDPVADTTKMAIGIFEYATGHERIEGADQTFYVQPHAMDFRGPDRKVYSVYHSGKPDSVFPQPISNYYLNKPGDSIPVGKSLYVLDSVDMVANKLTLRYAGVNHGLGITAGTIAKDFTGEDILTARPVGPSALRGKYLLLDFWGTWCGPCKETVPGLKDLHAKNAGLQLLSIAAHDTPDKVTRYLKEEGIDWPNICEDSDNKAPTVSERYNVTDFPTFILIDKDGKIIFRENSLQGLADLQKMIPRVLNP